MAVGRGNRAVSPGSIDDSNGGSSGGVFEENLHHALGHADVTVAVGHAGEESLVEAHSGAAEPHEVGHGGSCEAGAWRHGVLTFRDIAHDDIALGVDVVAVEVRDVVRVFLGDFVASGRCAISLAAAGDRSAVAIKCRAGPLRTSTTMPGAAF